MTFDLDLWPTDLNINRDHLVIKDYLPTEFEASGTKRFLSYQLHKVGETNMTFDLDLWPTDLTIDRDHLLIMDYLPTKFEVYEMGCCWVIGSTLFFVFVCLVFFFLGGGLPTDRPIYRHVQSNKSVVNKPILESGNYKLYMTRIM